MVRRPSRGAGRRVIVSAPGRRAILVLAVALAAGLVEAGPEKVAFPRDYQTRLFIFDTANDPATKTIRIMYVTGDTIRRRQPGKPLAYGTVLVVEHRPARLDDSGTPLKDREGRFVPTDQVVSVWVQEKRQGWGAEYPPAERTGEWEFADFLPDGSPKAGAKLAECRACHRKRAAQDYTFRFYKFLQDLRD
jgi:hypothetical protein